MRSAPNSHFINAIDPFAEMGQSERPACRLASAVGLAPGRSAALTPLELQRLHQMKNATRRAEMLASFRIRRYLIADMMGVLPEDVKLETLADGAPALTHPVGWSVSLANKESYTVAALARAPSQIGVDIEVIREINWRPALSMTCSDAERDEIFAASENGPGDLRTFFRMWTLKEAVLKSTGEGFRAGPKRIETPLAILRAPGAGALNAFGDVFDFWTVDTGEMIISLVKKRA